MYPELISKIEDAAVTDNVKVTVRSIDVRTEEEEEDKQTNHYIIYDHNVQVSFMCFTQV